MPDIWCKQTNCYHIVAGTTDNELISNSGRLSTFTAVEHITQMTSLPKLTAWASHAAVEGRCWRMLLSLETTHFTVTRMNPCFDHVMLSIQAARTADEWHSKQYDSDDCQEVNNIVQTVCTWLRNRSSVQQYYHSRLIRPADAILIGIQYRWKFWFPQHDTTCTCITVAF